MATRKPTRRVMQAKAVAIPVPELTVTQALGTWRSVVAIVGGAAIIGSAALWILSTQFARVADLKRVEDTQVEMGYDLKTKDLEVNSIAQSAHEGVKDIKTEIVEIRKEQRQTSENLIRLMERFSVKPVEAK